MSYELTNKEMEKLEAKYQGTNAPAMRKDLRDFFQMSDGELIFRILNQQHQSSAIAEINRRQMEAIKNFNNGSTFLACVMIVLSIIMIVQQFLK